MMSSAQIPIMIGSDKATQTIIAPVQHDLIAAQRYEVGDLFIFNNGLYKVTTAIAQGGTITIGTSAGCNAQAVSTLAEELIQRVDDVDSGYINGSTKELSLSISADEIYIMFTRGGNQGVSEYNTAVLAFFRNGTLQYITLAQNTNSLITYEISGSTLKAKCTATTVTMGYVRIKKI